MSCFCLLMFLFCFVLFRPGLHARQLSPWSLLIGITDNGCVWNVEFVAPPHLLHSPIVCYPDWQGANGNALWWHHYCDTAFSLADILQCMVGLVAVCATCFFDVIQYHPPPTLEQELRRLRLFHIINGSLLSLEFYYCILVVSCSLPVHCCSWINCKSVPLGILWVAELSMYFADPYILDLSYYYGRYDPMVREEW